MKNNSNNIFVIIAIVVISLFILVAVCPFDLIDLHQVQRIAKWKSDFEKLDYCFSLVNMHEGGIIKQSTETGKIQTEESILEHLKPYFNFSENELSNKKYCYKKKNGRRVARSSQFYFDKFIKTKDGSLISIKRNEKAGLDTLNPEYFMFVDINGTERPNRIGQDIFLLNVYPDHISALGHDKKYSKLKTNCSPIGSGLYCSELYLLGAHL